MSLLNTHRLSKCPLNRRAGDIRPSGDTAFKGVLDRFLSCRPLSEPLLCSCVFQITERENGVQCFLDFFDWCSTEHNERPGWRVWREMVFQACACSLELGQRGGLSIWSQATRCGVAPILNTRTQDVFGGIVRDFWTGV